MWGRTGGMREDRAALLASNGFAALTIAYCLFKDLPGRYGVLDLSYFERAVDWLIAHPKVNSDGVSLVGFCLGGVLALAIASQIPHKIKAVVSISGYQVLIGCSLKCQAMTLPGYSVNLTPGNDTYYMQFKSIFKSREAFKSGSLPVIPVGDISCPVLLVYGLADELNPEIEWMNGEIFRYMDQRDKGSLCTRLPLPGAGHFITPSYLPPCSKQYLKIFDEVWFLGGDNKTLQAKASEKYWNESLDFLLKNG